ncbi:MULTISPECIES: hypothetical protein [unclassified Nostoc]|uniref:hypothetical protein n=1 Tax=unclassified Nostoc TaxID=2593658 RepID=UPI0025EF57BF|nr:MULTISPECIES: hypothetical protein [unclassified Nostoc]MBN3992414.1 hypothetical protein [Nostoc sp. NMS2]
MGFLFELRAIAPLKFLESKLGMRSLFPFKQPNSASGGSLWHLCRIQASQNWECDRTLVVALRSRIARRSNGHQLFN